MTYDLHGIWDRNNPIGNIVQGHTNLTEIGYALELFWYVELTLLLMYPQLTQSFPGVLIFRHPRSSWALDFTAALSSFQTRVARSLVVNSREVLWPALAPTPVAS